MYAAAWLAGFNPVDYHMSDISDGRASLDKVRVLLPVGGFAYKDVDGAGKGWSAITQFNDRAREEFRRFYERLDTLSFGPCNACQWLSLLGWAPLPGIEDRYKPRFLRNTLGRFRRDFVAVRIYKSPSIAFTGMEGSILGVHVAHGEGRFYVPRWDDMLRILDDGLAPGRYVDPSGLPTSIYPWNPNGSPYGIAFVCDPTGRHTIGMPHPERGFLPWQAPWLPIELRGLRVGLWLYFFQNLRRWCEDTQSLAIAA
jgi:phosphoribosylformylglycinamidine synthase